MATCEVSSILPGTCRTIHLRRFCRHFDALMPLFLCAQWYDVDPLCCVSSATAALQVLGVDVSGAVPGVSGDVDVGGSAPSVKVDAPSPKIKGVWNDNTRFCTFSPAVQRAVFLSPGSCCQFFENCKCYFLCFQTVVSFTSLRHQHIGTAYWHTSIVRTKNPAFFWFYLYV